MRNLKVQFVLMVIIVACFFGGYYTVKAYRHHTANVEINILEKAVEAYNNAPVVDVVPMINSHKRRDVDSR